MARRRKFCKFCADKVEYIDYKDVRSLNQYVPERGKIMPRRISGVCSRHQRRLKPGHQDRSAPGLAALYSRMKQPETKSR